MSQHLMPLSHQLLQRKMSKDLAKPAKVANFATEIHKEHDDSNHISADRLSC